MRQVLHWVGVGGGRAKWRAGVYCGLVVGLGLAGCDRKWDFECTAVWTDDGKEASREVYHYPQMNDEKAATARCKDEMLEARPKGANAAVCKCIGQE